MAARSMKAKQMRLTLIAFAGAFDKAGCGEAGEELRQLARVFDDTAGESTVAALVKKIETNWKHSGRSPSHPGELKAVVLKLGGAFETSGATQQGRDFASLVRLFVGAPNQTVDAFVADSATARINLPRRRATNTGLRLLVSFCQESD
jgi:hypothetical protein